MGDLENLLLEAAGRTSNRGTKRNAREQSSRKNRAAHPGNSSDSGNDSDYHSKRKQSSGSYFPLKKRSNNRENDDRETLEEEDTHDRHSERRSDSSDESDVGSDLYKDEDDREQLAQLTELERELILSDRASKKDDKNFHQQMKSRWKSSEHQSESGNHVSPPRVRSSTRSADRSGAKAEALNELRARRMKQREPEAARHRFGGDPSQRGVFSREYSPTRQKGLLGSSRSDSGSEDDGSIRDDNLDSGSDDEGSKPDSDLPTFDDVKNITLRRSKLARWFMEPFFEDLVVGCFVRVGIGVKSGQNVYRLCMVQHIDSSDPSRWYQLENKNTFKYLNCVWGHESSAASWQMARVSDSPPSREEFDQWVHQVHLTGGYMPTQKDVSQKLEAIEKANNFVYSAETVKQMLQEKKSTSRPVNIAAERGRLQREKEIAELKNDELEVGRIKTQLQELEAARQSEETDKRALRLLEMNKKNRAENFKNASGSKKGNQNLKAGEAGYDPFSRRWTRSTNYYSAKPEGGEPVLDPRADTDAAAGAGSSQPGEKGVVDAEVAASKAALEEAAEAGKLVDTNAPVDRGGTQLNILHGFELPISLTKLQRYGGHQGAVAAYMARRQKIEASVGCRAPEDDGRNHPFSLTVGDYKRRRGLL